jgi:hypothetical protein
VLSAVRKRLVITAASLLLLVGSTVAVRAATTAPQRPDGTPAIEAFDPEHVGATEQEAWEAYYHRDWLRLFQLLLGLIQGQFGLSTVQALEAAYLATQAQVTFAERGASDGVAEEYMRQFYALVRDPSGGVYDPTRAAALEVGWWVVHRNRAQYPDATALVEALAALYSEVYGLPAGRVRAAAEHRAAAVAVSDRWVEDGRERGSPLLHTVREELVSSYAALQDALVARREGR